jgi:uncharacterized membrane protein YdcZ (DUF606 family)
VADAGPWAHFVDTTTAFADHGVCGAAPWIAGVSGALVVSSSGTVTPQIAAGSFHPTVDGQQAIAAAVRAAGFTD